MKKTKLFLFLTQAILFFSIISCNNPLSFNTQSHKTDFPSAATGTVSGKLTFKGAIPQELIGKNTNSTNTKTAFPTVDETTCTYEITVYDSINNVPYEDITATFNNNHTEYTLKGIPLGSPCTVEVNVYKDETKTKKILTGQNTFTLNEDNSVISENIELSPLTTNDGKGTVKLAIKWEYTTPPYIECSPIEFALDTDNTPYYMILDHAHSPMNSGSYPVTVNFWSGNSTNKGILLYSFTETINIFDNLETNTWVKNSSGTNADPHLKLRDDEIFIADCIITQVIVKNFQSTTLYVDTTANSSSNTGTFSNPFTTLQAAVDHINSYGNTTDKYTIYIKENITSSERILSIGSNLSTRNITIAGYNVVKTIVRTTNKDTSFFDFDNANYTITLRDLILEGNNTQTTSSNCGAIYNGSNLTLENVKIQNFISSRSSGQSLGGAIYNNGTLTLKKSKIIGCSCQSRNNPAFGGAIYNVSNKTLTLDDVVISDCHTQADAESKESYGGGIYNDGTCTINKAIITGCSAIANSESPSYAKGGAIYNKGSLILGDSICNSDGSPDVTIGIGTYNGEEYLNPNEAFAGAGVFSGDTSTAAIFTMNKDCVIGKYNPDRDPTKERCGNRSCSTSLLGNGGAGVWISTNNKTMTINGGFISYNYAEHTADNPSNAIPITGVGLCFYGNETTPPEIKNLVISYNKAYIRCNLDGSVQGIGFYFYRSVTLNNVKIENNTYETPSTTQVNGKGLYSTKTSTVTLKGTTCFGTSDDIYLGYSSPNTIGKIKVDSTLNPQNTFGVPQQYVATITPGSYAADLQILEGSALATEYTKFAVRQDPNTSDIYWRVNKSGFLDTKIGTKTKGVNLAVGDIVFNDGSSIPYSEGLTLSEEEKSAAIAVIFRVGDGSDGNKTLGVGIQHEPTACFERSSKGYSIIFNSTVCKPDDGTTHGSFTFINSENTDGSQNLKKMIDAGANDTGIIFNPDGTVNFESSNQTTLTTNYPAFEFAYYYGKNGHNIISESEYETGWYLPSVSELNDIYLANNSTNIIQKALIAAGGIDFNNKNYLTSTQECDSGYTNCVTGFFIDEGRKNYIGKDTDDNKRYACAVRAFD